MGMQEFIATFAVDIDEGGVAQLQSILEENTGLAEALAAAFRDAESAIQSFMSEASGLETPLSELFNQENTSSTVQDVLSSAIASADTEVILKVSADVSKAESALNSLKRSDATKLSLTADASGITAAANNALSSIKSTYANTTLTLKAEVKKEGGAASGGSSTDSSGGGSASGSSSGGSGSSGSARSSVGGRFSRPTITEVAEDRDPEYIIPIKKESIAVPLIRQMMNELSASARESLSDKGSLSSLSKQLSSVPSPGVSNSSCVVSAPVNINVNSSNAQPEAVGRSVYNLAEKYMVNSLKGVFA